MPGHKGKAYTGPEKYDITEVSGADVLYSADGIIKESEAYASELFRARTFYSTEGSTLAIKAMLKLATDGRKRGERPLILAGRNAHRSFVSSAALLDLDVEWIYPEGATHIASLDVDANTVKRAIESLDRRIFAVYITSPDYLGGRADIKAIAEVCKKREVPLLVDNAHGAYLAFLEPSAHPIALGATMCADSAHKTLPVLTGGAYLHISNEREDLISRAEGALSLFASTSPSYLILRSLDKCNEYLSGKYRLDLRECTLRVDDLKRALRSSGVEIIDTEPLKITVSAKDMGYTGTEISDFLRENGCECEFSDGDYTVMMITPDNDREDLEKIYTALSSLKKREPISRPEISISKAPRAMSIRDATLSLSEKVNVEEAEGRICAVGSVACPPAIPIVIAGEVIGPEEINALSYYGITEIDVIK